MDWVYFEDFPEEGNLERKKLSHCYDNCLTLELGTELEDKNNCAAHLQTLTPLSPLPSRRLRLKHIFPSAKKIKNPVTPL